ncbi:MAG: aminopeptidase [Myxococcota bacterium]
MRLKPITTACLFLALLALPGCSPPYLVHLGIGQGRIMLAREGYRDVLKDPRFAPADKSMLLVIQEVKRFGEEEIGLAGTDNFDSYVRLNREAVSWIVLAAEKSKLVSHEWWFPFVGRVPYKGYFSKKRALEEADRMAARGFDTHVRPVAAYSTLGYFSDPVFSTFLRYPESNLPELILHELTHATLFVKGEVDFNEGFATFVGYKGGVSYLESRYGPGSPLVAEARARFRDDLAFGRFVSALSRRLEKLYDEALPLEASLSRRAAIFAEEKEAFRELRRSFAYNRYDAFVEAEWNNALVLGHRRYYGDLPRYEALYTNLGRDLGRVVAWFVDAEKRGEKPAEALRRGAAMSGDAAIPKENG